MLHFLRFPITLSTVRTAAFHAIGSHVGPSFIQFAELTTNNVQHKGSLPHPTKIRVANLRDLEVSWSKDLEEQQATLSREIKLAQSSLAISIANNSAMMEEKSKQFRDERKTENEELCRHLKLRKDRHDAAIDRVKNEIDCLHVGSYIHSLPPTLPNCIIGLASNRSNQEETAGGRLRCTKCNRYVIES